MKTMSQKPYDNRSIFVKIFLIFIFISIDISVLYLWANPSKMYELSIYNSTPLLFWAIIIFSLICAILLILYELYMGYHSKRHLWFFGFLIIYFVYIIMLSLYIIKGYYLWNIEGDTGTHISSIYTTIFNGSVSSNIIYPLLYILTSQIYLISNLDVLYLSKLLLFIFNIIYILFMYVFIKAILREKGQIIIAITLSCAFVAGFVTMSGWHLYFIPYVFINILLPVTVYSLINFYKKRTINWGISSIILILLYPPFHPVAAIAILLVIISLLFYNFIYNKISHADIHIIRTQTGIYFISFMILLVWFVTWIGNFWRNQISSTYTSITGGTTDLAALGENVLNADSYGYSIFQIIEQVIKIDGGAMLYVIIVFIYLPLIYIKIKNKKLAEYLPLISLYFPILFMIASIIILYLTYTGFGPLRFLEYIVVFCIPIIGYIVYDLIKKFKFISNKFVKLFSLSLIILLLSALFINGIFSLYPSPYTLSSNPQTTETEINGMAWMYNFRDLGTGISSISVSPTRYLFLIQNNSFQKYDEWMKIYLMNLMYTQKVPYHFSYTKNNSLLSNYYNYNVYIILLSSDRYIYTDIWPDMAKYRFYKTDFDKLLFDTSLEKLYDNGEFNTWYVLST